MNAEPLSKKIYDKAKKLGVEQIRLLFSGGSDEGYLHVELLPYEVDSCGDFAREIDDWAWEVYNYSGAGEGVDYGDTINYDLQSGEVTTEEWYHVVKTEKGAKKKLKIAKDEDEE